MEEAVSEAARRRKRREKYLRDTGRPLMVYPWEAERARSWARSLHNRGMTYTQIGRLSGLSRRTVCYAATADGSPMKRRTMLALLSVKFVEPDPSAWVSPVGTRRRLGSLWRDGFTLPWIAEQAGVGNRGYFQALIRGSKGSAGVEYVTHRAIAELYDKLENAQPGDVGIDTRASRFSATFARNKGLVPRFCWTEETLDDPEAYPDWTGYCGTGFGMSVHRRDGIPPCDRCKEAYDYRNPYPGFNGDRLRDLREQAGLSRNEICTQLGMGWTMLRDWETGRSKPQRQARLDRVLELLDATYEDVCDGLGEELGHAPGGEGCGGGGEGVV